MSTSGTETPPNANSDGQTKPVLEDGCYLIRYEPAEPIADVLFFEGTARIMPRVIIQAASADAKTIAPIPPARSRTAWKPP